MIVLQGDEGLNPRDCPVRDAYEVSDIPARPAGDTRIKVTYKYNANGVIEVEAEDVHSKNILPIRPKADDIDWDALESPGSVVMPMDIALVIDCSGSMMDENRLADAKEAACRFLDSIDTGMRVGLVSFSGFKATIRAPLTQHVDALQGAIGNLSASGSTPMDKAIKVTATEVLVSSKNTNVLILLTDGEPEPGTANATVREADRAKEQGIRIITIGVGDGVDQKYLQHRISSTPDDYYFVNESVQLESTFVTIARSSCDGIFRPLMCYLW